MITKEVLETAARLHAASFISVAIKRLWKPTFDDFIKEKIFINIVLPSILIECSLKGAFQDQSSQIPYKSSTD